MFIYLENFNIQTTFSIHTETIYYQKSGFCASRVSPSIQKKARAFKLRARPL